jgi:serine/threonine protein kinase
MPSRVVAGRYRLERILGEGACGRVYLARDTKERGSVWAVKEVDYSALPISEFAEARHQFQREAQLLKGLRHPSLPTVVDHFQEGDRDYLVMERVEGPTLEGLLKGRTEPLPEGRVVALGLALADTLHYLHHRNPPVIYRDLKPANVMVTLSGGVKLIDFGIARSVNPAKVGDTTAYGTPGYAPPEQYQGRTVAASDVYALGVTLHRASTLYEPPEFTFTHPSAASLNPDLSPAFDRLLAAMLSKRIEDRPHTSLVLSMLSAIRDVPENDALRIWWRRSSRHFKKWWSTKRGKT